MSNWKFAAPVGLAALCVSSIVMAGLDIVEIHKSDPKTHVITIHTGDHDNCDKMTSRATQAIPGKTTFKWKIKNESWVCVRRPGGKWYKGDLRGRKAVLRLTIDD